MIDTDPQPVVLGRQFIDIRERSVAILRVLYEGWKRASGSPRVHTDVVEVEITEHLRDGMREALKKNTAAYSKKMIILAGTESRSSPQVRRPDGRTDIPILFSDLREEYDEHDAHAIVECKRVAGNRRALCREYVVEGIDRFATGKYAGNQAVAFMAGYLLSGDAKSAATGNKRVPDKQTTPFGASGTLQRDGRAVGEEQSSSASEPSRPPHSPSRVLWLATAATLRAGAKITSVFRYMGSMV